MNLFSGPEEDAYTVPTENKNYAQNKLVLKSILISAIVLLLLVPGCHVQNLVQEREQRQKEAVAEISDKWAGRQVIAGPVLTLPYWKRNADTSSKVLRIKNNAYFLPRDLKITASVATEEKHRGIFKATVYACDISMTGLIEKPDLQLLNIAAEDVIWKEATIKFPVTDVKGLNEAISMQINEQQISLSPQTKTDEIKNALEASVSAENVNEFKELNFTCSYKLSGSDQILFTPVGKFTTIDLSSGWPHPSFVGRVLPQQTSVTDSGFTASWKSGSYKRSFPQQWTGAAFGLDGVKNIDNTIEQALESENVDPGSNINNYSFGAEFYIPVNNYQKIMRSVKYAALIIILTFAAFFLIDVNNKKSVHPFQYGLIGIALILFYTLLLSLSEHLGFNLSYALASIATIGLISWFVKSVLSSQRLAAALLSLLVLLYVYIFTILQLQDFALLFGSLGLFISLAVIMYYSRKLRW